MVNNQSLLILIASIFISFHTLTNCEDVFHQLEDFPLDENNRLVDHLFIYVENPSCVSYYSDEK